MTTFTEMPVENLRNVKRCPIDDGLTLVAFGNGDVWDGVSVGWSHLGGMRVGIGDDGPIIMPMTVVYIPEKANCLPLFDTCDAFSVSVLKPASRLELLRFSNLDSEDRVSGSSLTPSWIDGAPYFDGARVVYVCRKLNVQGRRGDWYLSDDEVSEHYPGMRGCVRCVGKVVRILKAAE